MQKNNNTKPLILALLLVSSNMYAQNKIELQPEDKEVKNSKKLQKHTSNVSAKIGLGYDSNPFLSPRNPYNDYTNSGGGALVTPENKSGL
jgi:NAD+--asparagine ADP-ribosyltransferase